MNGHHLAFKPPRHAGPDHQLVVPDGGVLGLAPPLEVFTDSEVGDSDVARLDVGQHAVTAELRGAFDQRQQHVRCHQQPCPVRELRADPPPRRRGEHRFQQDVVDIGLREPRLIEGPQQIGTEPQHLHQREPGEVIHRDGGGNRGPDGVLAGQVGRDAVGRRGEPRVLLRDDQPAGPNPVGRTDCRNNVTSSEVGPRGGQRQEVAGYTRGQAEHLFLGPGTSTGRHRAIISGRPVQMSAGFGHLAEVHRHELWE